MKIPIKPIRSFIRFNSPKNISLLMESYTFVGGFSTLLKIITKTIFIKILIIKTQGFVLG